MSRLQLLILTAICSMAAPQAAQGIPLSSFFSYGRSVNDTVLPRVNGASSPPVQLPQPFRLYGTNYSTAYVHADGLITFQNSSVTTRQDFPNEVPSVAAFWTNVDLASTAPSGDVYYRVTSDLLTTLNFTDRVSSAFRDSQMGFTGFTASQLLIVTWDRVKGVGTNETNTFQCVLATNHEHSYIFFLYADGMMQWAGSPFALVGLNAGDGVNHLTLPTSRSEAVLDLTRTANSGINDWIFRTDSSSIIQPGAVIGLDQPSYNVAEGDGSVHVCVVLYDGALARSVEVQVSSRMGGSADATDFTAASHSITFSDSEVSGDSSRQYCLEFAILDDDILEIDETFEIDVTLLSADTHVTILPHSTLVTIMDDDYVEIEAFAAIQTVDEGQTSNELCLNVIGEREDDITYYYSLSPDTAQEGVDYMHTEGEMTVSPNTRITCFPVSIVDDNIYKNGRYFTYTVGSHDDHVTVRNATGVAMIQDNDEGTVEVGFERATYTVVEGESVEVCVWMTAGRVGQPFVVNVTTVLTSSISSLYAAEVGVDFDKEMHNITFLPEDPLRTRKCFTITTHDDDVYEWQERYGVHMSFSNSFVMRNSPALLVIEDNDYVQVSLTESVYNATEGDYVLICANINGSVERDLHFDIDVEPRTAQVSGEHSDINRNSIRPNAITFRGGSDPELRSVCSSIFVVTDSTLEQNPESFTVNLTSAAMDPDPEHILLVNASAEVFVRDIDVVRVEFLRAKEVVSESDPDRPGVPVTLRACVLIKGHSSIDIPIGLSYAEGNATDGVDYSLIGGDVSFTGGTSESADVDCSGLLVEIYDDHVVEETEQVVIKLLSDEPDRVMTSFTGKPNMTILIEDDDVVHVSFVEQLLYVSEGNGGVDVCLQMRGFSTINLTANIATTQQSALAGVDFEPQSVQLTFPPTNQTILDDLYQLPIAEQLSAPLPTSSPVCSRVEIIDDDILEAVDEKLLRLDLTLGGPHVHFEMPSTVLVTILDDDVVTLEMEEVAVEVNEGDRFARVCATMQGSADFPIRAVFTTTADSAVAPGDYTSAPIVVEFPAKDNSPRCADVPIVDDQILEFTESFNVSLALSSPRHDRIHLGNTTETVVTIIDNDFVRVGFQQQDYSTIESAAEVTVCAELEGALLRPVSVSLSTSNDTGSAQAGVDYTPLTNVTLFAGTSSLSRQTECVEISLLHDSILENTEVIEVSLSSSDTAVRFTRPTTNIYILDDDGVRMGLMRREYTGSEGEEIEICVELVGMISQDIGLNIRTEPISAQADSDFTSFSLPLVFRPLPGSINNQRVCRNLSLLEDDIFEDQESLSVVMEVDHPRVSIHIERATVFIQDNDEVSLSFLSPAATVQEDVRQVEACVELQGSTEVDIEYSVATLSASAQDSLDYRFTPPSSPFSFAPSTAPSQRSCHVIEIIDDDLLESSEQFSVQLSNNNVSRVSVVTELMLVTIEDNDLVTVGLNRTEFLVLEEQVGGANISICTVLRGKLQKNVTVVLTTKTSSASSSDFTGLNETLTFVPSESAEQTICHTVDIHDDREVEGAEFFTVHLSSTESMVILQPDSAVVTISEGDVVCSPDNLLTSRGYYEWPQTYPSDTRELKCTMGGTTTRYCSLTGQWERPDVSNCLVSAAALFKYLMQHPFSEENFSELLYAVELVKIEGGEAKREYMEVVNSYFIQLTEKLNNDRSFRFTSEIFQMALDIADGVQEWPNSALQMYSSSFVSYTENLIDSFIRISNVTSLYHGMKHSSFFLEKGDVKDVFPTDKPKTIRFARDTASNNFVRVTESSSFSSEDVTSSITLPPSLSQLFTNSTGYVGAFFSMYNSGVMFPIAEGNGARRNETNVSSVISATVLDRAVRDLKDNITYTVQLNTDSQNISGVVCVSWDFDAVGGLGNWTDKGCTNLTNGTQGNVTCSCNHLTNFAVLVDVRPRPTEPGPVTVMTPFSLSVISIIGVAVSVLGLLLTIVTLIAFKKLRTRDSTVLRIQFCVAVTLMLLSFVAGIERVQLFQVCVTISTLIHYFTLVSVMWMAAEALLMFQKAVISTKVNYKFFVIISLACWLLPIPAAVVPVVLNRDFVTHEEFCFISHDIVFYAAFLGPIAAVLVFNLIIFLAVVCVVIRHSARRYRESQKYSKRKGIMLTMLNIIALSLLFGVTWAFGALTVLKRYELFEFLFVVSNSLQGFYVFIFFVVLAKETRELWLETCGCRKKKEEPDADTVPRTPTVTRVPSLRKPEYNLDDYGNRLEELTVDTPDTRKRMNSWDIMYVMPQNQFHVLMFADGGGQLQPHPELEQEEEDIEKELDVPLPKKNDASDGGNDIDNRSTADSGIMDDKAKSTPSPVLGVRSRQVEMAHPQPGGTPVHVHSVSGIGYVSDESAEDTEAQTSITSKKAKSHDRSCNIELSGRVPVAGSSGLTLETSRV